MRYDLDPPDDDRYEAKPTDEADVPDFDTPDTPALDAVDHAAQAVIASLNALEQQVARATDFNAVMAIRTIARALEERAAAVVNAAAHRADEIVERRR